MKKPNNNDNTLVIGNRGVKGKVMENTLESVQHAIDIGLDGVKIDVMSCFMGELILFHDTKLDRLVFKDEFYFDKIKGKSIDKLQWYHIYNSNLIDSMGRQYKIPKLETILYNDKVMLSDIIIVIELRDMRSHEKLCDVLLDLFEEGLYSPDRFIVISEDVNILSYFYEFKSEMIEKDSEFQKFGIGLILSHTDIGEDGSPFSKILHSKVLTHTIIESNININTNNINKIQEMGLKVFIYNDNVVSLSPINVNGIIIDKP
jgi:glycerophosphoryl diester phosphodiesterase